MGATLTLETETEQDRDQRAVMEKALKLNQVWALVVTFESGLGTRGNL